jgi:hypothetical protein
MISLFAGCMLTLGVVLGLTGDRHPGGPTFCAGTAFVLMATGGS